MESWSGARWNTAQLRSARALLGWSQRTMAQETGLALNVVKRGEGQVTAKTIDGRDAGLCVDALERAGIKFLWLRDDFGDDWYGVVHYDIRHRPPNLRLVVDND